MGSDEQPRQSDQQAQLATLTLRVEALERELARLGETRAAGTTTVSAAPAPFTVQPISSPAKSKSSLEDRIGSQLFSRIGIIALLVAVTLFLKWAIDNQWIGATGRILAGLIAGAAVVLWSERFRRKGFPAFSYALKAIGTGALYLSLWAAFQLYHLLPAATALLAMALITAWNAYMAWSQGSELLAAYALVGALATPLLLATGGNNEIFLFTYLLVIDAAAIALVRLKAWPRLLFGAFPATVAYFIAWYVEWFNASRHHEPVAITILFLACFFAIFVVPSLGREEQASSSITQIFLPLANAIFIALALYSVLEDAGYHDLLAWVAVFFAAVFLGLMRLPQTRVVAAVHLALSVTFLTVAIPLKVTGRWITIGWFTEGATLLWTALRLAPSDARSSLLLRRLAGCTLALGAISVLFDSPWLYGRVTSPFLNERFATSLFGVAALALCAWMALRALSQADSAFPSFTTLAASSIIALNLITILAVVRELDICWPPLASNPDSELQRSLAISAFLMLYGAALLAVGFWRRTAFLRWQALILLVFTIAKTFLYDLRDLSQGYRVLSFLGLGALLMAVSFAYQRDWLSLRTAKTETLQAPPSDLHDSASSSRGASH